MYVDTVPNRKSRPCILLRESSREGKRIIKRTIANLTDWPTHVVEAIRASLHGGVVLEKFEEAFEIVSSKAHGHVAAVLGSVKHLKLDKMIASKPCRELSLVCAMIVARIIVPSSKLATAQGLSEETSSSSLAEELGLEGVSEDDLYGALDWLLPRQERIEKKLCQQHLSGARFALFDVSSSYFEGKSCSLAKRGYSRDKRPDKLQIVYGLLCNEAGCPVAIEVFPGDTADPKTFTPQVKKLKERYGIERVVMVGDRGMITSARIEQDLKGNQGFDWITALRSVEIRSLVSEGCIQLSLFDQQSLVEIEHPDYPGERLIVCKNPLLAEERARRREDLLVCTEKELAKIAAATNRSSRALRGKERIALRVGKVISRFKMGKHFSLNFTETSFEYSRKQEAIAAEAALDGIYVVRSSVPSEELSAEKTVLAYKNLSKVERAFRCMKTVDLKIRPIYHRLADRVRAHVFLCMLAYYVEWNMRQKLASLLFDDDEREAAEERRESVVAPAQLSDSAMKKANTKVNAEGLPVQSFRSLLSSLGSVVKNTLQMSNCNQATFTKTTTPTPLQKHAFKLLGVSL